MSDFNVNLGFSVEEFIDENNVKESEMIWYFFREMDDEVYGMVTDWLLNKWDEFKENVRQSDISEGEFSFLSHPHYY